LDRGAELLPALEALCAAQGVKAGEIRAQGLLRDVVLTVHDSEARRARPPRTFASDFEILSLTISVGQDRAGRLALEARAALSRERDAGLEVVGGLLLSARVVSCELVIDTYDDLQLVREVDAAVGAPLLSEIVERASTPLTAPPTARAPEPPPEPPPPHAPPHAPEPPPRPPAPVAVAVAAEPPPPAPPAPPAPAAKASPQDDWARAIELSRMKDDEEGALVESSRPEPTTSEPEVSNAPPRTTVSGETDPTELRPGDLVEHPTFGRCDVLRVEEYGAYATLKLRSGRTVRLSLEVVGLTPLDPEGKRRVFRVVIER
jgi:predicted DNA-binding protein with PD1-like motif